MVLYSSKQVCEISGCTHRQLQYWEIKGYLSPNLGSRNVREYSEHDLTIVERIINYKRSGKSLGEAFVTSDTEISQPHSQIQSLMVEVAPLEAAWLGKSQALMKILDEIHELEASIPRFPYSIYEADKLNTLKTLQQKAVQIKEQKDGIYHQIQSILINQSAPLALPLTQSKTASSVQVYSIDQLVLLWLKRFGATNSTQEIRERLTKRLRTGESLDILIKELAPLPVP